MSAVWALTVPVQDATCERTTTPRDASEPVKGNALLSLPTASSNTSFLQHSAFHLYDLDCVKTPEPPGN